MKRITNKAASLSDADRKKLASLLKFQKPRNAKSSDLLSRLLTYTGLDVTLSECDRDELMLLRLLVTSGKAFTFSDIEKELNLPVQHIEKITDNLSSRLVVYVLKNRQLLNNKLDKVFLFPEIAEILSPINERELHKKLRSRSDNITNDPGKEKALRYNPNSHAHSLLSLLADHGGLATLHMINKAIPEASVEKILLELKEAGIISIFHNIEKRFITFVLVEKKYINALTAMYTTPLPEPGGYIHNRYRLLYSILKTYDMVTNYGLFLTQNRDFRKIDFSRVSGAMPQVITLSGKPLSRTHMASFCLYALYQMGLVRIRRENISITLKPVEEQLSRPASFLKKTMTAVIEQALTDELLPPCVGIPESETVQILKDRLTRLSPVRYSTLFTMYMLENYTSIMIYDLLNLPELKETIKAEFNRALNFLLIAGIAGMEDDTIFLTDIGIELYGSNKAVEQKKEQKRAIYINPDFTVMIPSREISSETQYHILAHTEIIQDDVIIHARITRQSILRAQQRGMDQDIFMHSLEQYSKNKIPQNLSFQLKEWVTRTLRIQIQRAILIRANDPEFIDELEEGKLKKGIAERISPHYAIINPDHLDRIIKASHRKEAVISIFEDDA